MKDLEHIFYKEKSKQFLSIKVVSFSNDDEI